MTASASDKAKAWLEKQPGGFIVPRTDDVASLTALLEAYGDERLEEAARAAEAYGARMLPSDGDMFRTVAAMIRALASHDAGAGREE